MVRSRLMKCPACGHEVRDAEPRCAVCDFTIDELKDRAHALPEAVPPGDICDPGGLLSRRHRAAIQSRIDAFEAATGGELRLVILPEIGPMSPAEAAFWLFNRWGLGGPGNRGVLVLLAVTERAIQCEVGYGIEPMLTDAEAGRVLDYHVVPQLRAGHLGEGLTQGIDLIADLIETAPPPP